MLRCALLLLSFVVGACGEAVATPMTQSFTLLRSEYQHSFQWHFNGTLGNYDSLGIMDASATSCDGSFSPQMTIFATQDTLASSSVATTSSFDDSSLTLGRHLLCYCHAVNANDAYYCNSTATNWDKQVGFVHIIDPVPDQSFAVSMFTQDVFTIEMKGTVSASDMLMLVDGTCGTSNEINVINGQGLSAMSLSVSGGSTKLTPVLNSGNLWTYTEGKFNLCYCNSTTHSCNALAPSTFASTTSSVLLHSLSLSAVSSSTDYPVVQEMSTEDVTFSMVYYPTLLSEHDRIFFRQADEACAMEVNTDISSSDTYSGMSYLSAAASPTSVDFSATRASQTPFRLCAIHAGEFLDFANIFIFVTDVVMPRFPQKSSSTSFSLTSTTMVQSTDSWFLLTESVDCASVSSAPSNGVDRMEAFTGAGTVTMNFASLTDHINLKLCIAKGGSYSDMLDVSLLVTPLDLAGQQVTSPTSVVPDANVQTVTLSFSSELQNNFVVWFRRLGASCGLAGFSTSDGSGIAYLSSSPQVLQLRFDGVVQSSESVFRLCVRNADGTVFSYDHTTLIVNATPGISPTSAPATVSNPTPAWATPDADQLFFVSKSDGDMQTLQWSHEGSLTPFDQLGLFPVNEPLACSGALSPRAFYQWSAHQPTSASAASSTSQLTGMFSTEQLPSGRYIVCYCQAENGEPCGYDDTSAWSSLVGHLIVLDVPSVSQHLAVSINSFASITAYLNTPAQSGVLNRMYSVVDGQACGSISSNSLTLQAQLPTSSVNTLGQTGWTISSVFASTGIYHLCFCDASHELGQTCPINGVKWQQAYGGPVATLLVHDVTVSGGVARAPAQLITVTWSSVIASGDKAWFQQEDEPCRAGDHTMSGRTYSSAAVLTTSNAALSFDFSNVVSEGQLFRLCVRQEPSDTVRDLQNVGVYLPDITVTPVTPARTSTSVVTLTFSNSLEANDHLWFASVSQACGLSYPLASSSTSNYQVISLAGAYSFDFASVQLGKHMRACVAKGGVYSADTIRDYSTVEVQPLDSSVSLIESEVQNQPGQTVTLSFTNNALTVSDQLWFARSDQACGLVNDAQANFRSGVATLVSLPATLAVDFDTVQGNGLTHHTYRLCVHTARATSVLDYKMLTVRINSYQLAPTSVRAQSFGMLSLSWTDQVLLPGQDSVWWTQQGQSCGVNPGNVSSTTQSASMMANVSGAVLSFDFTNCLDSSTSFRLCTYTQADGLVVAWDSIVVRVASLSISPASIQAGTNASSLVTITHGASLSNANVWLQEMGHPCNLHAQTVGGQTYSNYGTLGTVAGTVPVTFEFQTVQPSVSGATFRACAQLGSLTSPVIDLTSAAVTVNATVATPWPAAPVVTVFPSPVSPLPVYSVKKEASVSFTWDFLGSLPRDWQLSIVPASSTVGCLGTASLSFWASLWGGEISSATTAPFNTDGLVNGRYHLCHSSTQFGWLIVVNAPSLDQTWAVQQGSVSTFHLQLQGVKPTTSVLDRMIFIDPQHTCGMSSATLSMFQLANQPLTSDNTTVNTHFLEPAPTSFVGNAGVYKVCYCQAALEPSGACASPNSGGTWYNAYARVGQLLLHDVQLQPSPLLRVPVIAATAAPTNVALSFTTVLQPATSQAWFLRSDHSCISPTSSSNISSSTFTVQSSGASAVVDFSMVQPTNMLLRLCATVSGTTLDFADVGVSLTDLILSPRTPNRAVSNILYNFTNALNAGDDVWFLEVQQSCHAVTPPIAGLYSTAAVTIDSRAVQSYAHDFSTLIATGTFRLCRGLNNYETVIDLSSTTLTLVDPTVSVTTSLVQNHAEQTVQVVDTQGTLVGAELWFAREDRDCMPAGASALSSDKTSLTYAGTVDLSFNFITVQSEHLSQQQHFRLCAQAGTSVLNYPAVQLRVLDVSVSPRSVHAADANALLTLSSLPSDSLMPNDQVWWQRSDTACVSVAPTVSTVSSSQSQTLLVRGQLLSFDFTNTVASAEPYRLCVKPSSMAVLDYSVVQVQVIDVQVQTISLTPAAQTSISLTWSSPSLALNDHVWWQSNDQPCLTAAPPSGSEPSHSAATVWTQASASSSTAVDFDFTNTQTPYVGAPYRLCMQRGATVFDYDLISVAVYGPVAAPSSASPTLAPPPTPVTSPTAVQPTIAPAPTSALLQGLPALQVFTVTKNDALPRSLTWDYQSASLHPFDTLELLPALTGSCGDHVTTPVTSFLASPYSTLHPAQSAAWYTAGLTVGKYALCYCQGQSLPGCSGNLTNPRVALGYVHVIALPSEITSQQFVMRGNTLSASAESFTLKLTSSPAAGDRLLLIERGGVCGMSAPQAVFGSHGIEVLSTSIVAPDSNGHHGLKLQPTAYPQTGFFDVCYCNSLSEAYGCPVSGPNWQASYGGKVGELVLHDLSFNALDPATIGTVARAPLQIITPSYNSIFTPAHRWWVQRADVPCMNGLWSGGAHPTFSKVSFFTTSNDSTTHDFSYAVADKAVPYRACVRLDDDRVLDLPDTGVVVMDIALTSTANPVRAVNTQVSIQHGGGSAATGDMIWWLAEGLPCSAALPPVAGPSSTDAANVTGLTGTYAFDMSQLVSQSKYRLCIAWNSYSQVRDYSNIGLVPVSAPMSVSQSHVSNAGNQPVGLFYSPADLQANDILWFQRADVECDAVPSSGTSYSSQSFSPAGNGVPVMLDFSQVLDSSLSLTPYRLCTYVEQHQKVSDFASVRIFVAKVSVGPASVHAGDSAASLSLSYSGQSLNAFSDVTWWQKSTEACVKPLHLTNSPTTGTPTTNPTLVTSSPTSSPSAAPTDSPVTGAPSNSPTLQPSNAPSNSPTPQPSNAPTQSPTLQPSNAPSNSPTLQPSNAPTPSPVTTTPTLNPSVNPTSNPTVNPTGAPTSSPITSRRRLLSRELLVTTATISSATSSDVSAAPISDQVQSYDFSNTVHSGQDTFRLCVETSLSDAFGAVTSVTVDMSEVKIIVTDTQLNQASITPASGQQVSLSYGNGILQVGSQVWFRDTSQACSLGAPLAASTTQSSSQVVATQGNGAAGAGVLLSFDFSLATIGSIFRLCAFNGASFLDLGADKLTIAGISVLTTAVQPSAGQQVVISWTAGMVTPGSIAWFQTPSVPCAGTFSTSWSADAVKSSPVVLSSSNALYTFDFSALASSRIEYRLCLSVYGQAQDQAHTGVHVATVNIQSPAMPDTMNDMTLSYSPGLLIPGSDQVWFQKVGFPCSGLPSLSSPSSGVALLQNSDTATSFNFTGVQGTQAAYRLCAFDPIASETFDFTFATVLVVDATLSREAVSAAANQTLSLSWTGASFIPGDSVYLSAEPTCASTFTPTSLTTAAMQTITTSGQELKFDLSAATPNSLVTTLNWRLCVLSSTFGPLDYAQATDLQVWDLRVSINATLELGGALPVVQPLSEQPIILTFTQSLSSGALVWFSNVACTTGAPLLSSNNVSDAVVVKQSGDVHNFDFSNAVGAYSEWHACGSQSISSTAVQIHARQAIVQLGATLSPTQSPTMNPTSSPTSASPSVSPTLSPSVSPTNSPSAEPTVSPTTSMPTSQPTSEPTMQPTSQPTLEPTAQPTVQPTVQPTQQPTFPIHTAQPTTAPTLDSGCADKTIAGGLPWFDSYGSIYTCQWYTEPGNCERWGGTSTNFGMVANEACCVCGGGIDTSTPVTAEPTSAPTQAGFDFGSGCEAGDGSFVKPLPVKDMLDDVGTIPAGKFDVEIQLTSDQDIDITLYDLSETGEFAEGKAIVQWCSLWDVKDPSKNCGLLGESPSEGTLNYKGMTITYSGYEGDGTNWGHEFIRIQGETSVDLRMKVFAYEAGNADVQYSWGQSQTDCCTGVANACGGSFVATLKQGEIIEIGEIPVGKGDLIVSLEADVDIDIQLYDLDDTAMFAEGQAIIAYCEPEATCNYGPLTQEGAVSGTYRAVEYEYSGWDGVDGKKGNEYIRINGVTNHKLMMTFYGYISGPASVSYSYTEPQDDGSEVKNLP